MGTPPILMRSRNNGALPAISPHLGKHLGVNGDHVAAIEIDPGKARRVLGLRGGYDEFHKGKPITTMTYDHWVGKRGNAHDGTRFTLQEILLSQLTNFLYDDGRGDGSEPTWWGREKKRSIATWSRHIEILAMVEETMDGEFYGRAAERQRPRAAERRPGRDRPLRLLALRAVGARPRARPTRRSGGSPSGAGWAGS